MFKKNPFSSDEFRSKLKVFGDLDFQVQKKTMFSDEYKFVLLKGNANFIPESFNGITRSNYKQRIKKSRGTATQRQFTIDLFEILFYYDMMVDIYFMEPINDEYGDLDEDYDPNLELEQVADFEAAQEATETSVESLDEELVTVPAITEIAEPAYQAPAPDYSSSYSSSSSSDSDSGGDSGGDSGD